MKGTSREADSRNKSKNIVNTEKTACRLPLSLLLHRSQRPTVEDASGGREVGEIENETARMNMRVGGRWIEGRLDCSCR